MKRFLFLLSLMSVTLPHVKSQVFPGFYFYPGGHTIISVNGSSEDGNCNITGLIQCDSPTTSVLQDGIIPTLTGLDGGMWASQLLTINTVDSTTDIGFNFEATSGYVGVERVEVVMFNCPELGISVDSITLRSTTSFLSIINPTITSCDSLVRVCISRSVSAVLDVLTLRFQLGSASTWVHLAEVSFYGAGTCPPDSILNPPPTTSSSTTSDETDPTDSDLTSAATTDSTEPTTPGSSSLTVVIAAVVAVVILIIIIIVIAVIAIIFYVRSKNRSSKIYSNFLNVQGGGGGIGTLDKTPDIELTGQKSDVGGIAVYEDIHHKESGLESKGGGVYEGIDDVVSPRYEKTGESYPSGAHGGSGGGGGGNGEGAYSSVDTDNQTYNKLIHTSSLRRNTSTLDESQGNYSKIDREESFASSSVAVQRAGTISEANNPIYSDPDAVHKRRFTSPPRPFSKPKPSAVPQPIQDSEYAVIGTTGAPKIPDKSNNLVDYLETKNAVDKKLEVNVSDGGDMDDVYSQPTKNTSPNKLASSAISDTALNNNPLYASTDYSEEDNVYAEPGAAAVPEPNPSGNIYEAIYTESSLHPDSFTRELSPEEGNSSDDLCPYSSIYTVPIVGLNEKPLSVTVDNIKKIKVLGSGNFGEVFLAKTVGLSCFDLKMSSSTDTQVMVSVAIKMLKPNPSVSTRNLFDKECRFMSRLDHPNVIRLLGICKTGTPYIMMEYMEKGDLNQFLQSHKCVVDGDTPGDKEIAKESLISICTQIASAMNYLASNNFVHRDLATRNVLVGENYQVKIADFGMSRSLYESHYYIIKGHAILPIRWMAAECFYGKFSAKTDVWAFGATMWEIFMLSKREPYFEMEDRNLVKDAIKGANRKLLTRPQDCPLEVYKVMLRCWRDDPNERATFEELYESLFLCQQQ